MLAHIARQRCDIAGCDIGRVRDDEIEAAIERSAKIHHREGGARRPKCSGIAACGAKRFSAAVGADAEGVRQFMQQREEDRA